MLKPIQRIPQYRMLLSRMYHLSLTYSRNSLVGRSLPEILTGMCNQDAIST